MVPSDNLQAERGPIRADRPWERQRRMTGLIERRCETDQRIQRSGGSWPQRYGLLPDQRWQNGQGGQQQIVGRAENQVDRGKDCFAASVQVGFAGRSYRQNPKGPASGNADRPYLG